MPDAGAAAGAGAGGCAAHAAGAEGSACGAVSFIAETKGEPNGSDGEVAMSEGVDARCCDCGVNKLEMDACGSAVAADRCSAAAGWDAMPNGDPLGLPPNENGDAAGAEPAAPADGWEGSPKGDPLLPGPKENGDPAAGAGACCGAGCPSENGLAGAAGSAVGMGGVNPEDEAANCLNWNA